MIAVNCPVLDSLLESHNSNPEFLAIQSSLKKLQVRESKSSTIDELLALYKLALPQIEKQIWAGEIDVDSFLPYQQLFRELEACHQLKYDDRHHFIVVIPVADRPQHLASCLGSILELCERFNYGGKVDGVFHKIQVMVADDSKQPENIERHREISNEYQQRGLQTLYFGAEEQLAQLKQLPDGMQQQLISVLGNNDADAFYHKGASITRNIAYLKLKSLLRPGQKQLFYFIDSDQEFKVKVSTRQGDRDVFAVNFFYYLDRIFTESDVNILTGKVVGDPPVSPSVMAGNFLEDVICFLTRISALGAGDACQFHNQEQVRVDDAAYHDMADLFGFRPSVDSYQYNCTLDGTHDHHQCLVDFADKLNHFFDGAHPTRKTYYEYENALSNLKPARTIYTGNYIFRPDMLRYFVPFARLKLRMAGPVLGRIIRSDMSARFVSANLPMLHKRTVDSLGQSEFRPGVERSEEVIDLCSEFERQFFGDVMLFTVEALAGKAYPQQSLPDDEVLQVLHATEQKMQQQYKTRHQQIIEKLAMLSAIFNDQSHWWNSDPGLVSARRNIARFINNIEHNFGVNASAYRLINSAQNREQRLREIHLAIIHYVADRQLWQGGLELR